MIQEFNNRTKQESTRLYLQSLKLRNIMESKSIDEPKALEFLRDEITKYAPNGPIEYRSDRVMVEYMHDALITEEWSKDTLSNCYTLRWSFNDFYIGLTSAWYQEQRRKKALSNSNSNTDTDSSIFWESQKMYGKPRTNGLKKFHSKTKSYKDYDCWNCGEKGHTHSHCPHKQKNMTRNVHNALKNNPRKANRILFEICQCYDNDDSSDSEDDNPFETNYDTKDETSLDQNNNEEGRTKSLNFVEQLNKDKEEVIDTIHNDKHEPWDF